MDSVDFVSNLRHDSSAVPQNFTVRPITGGCGAEIFGVDLSAPLHPQTVAGLRQVLLEHLVIFFHDQHLEPDGLRTFGQYFGEIEKERFIPALEGHEGIHVLRGISKNKLTTQNLIWHVDHSYKEMPSMAAALYAVDVPEAGGDTLFANMYKAYDALSPGMKQCLEGRVAVHDLVAYGIRSGLFETAEQRAAISRMPAPVEHPLVCVHPETGRKMLFVNEAWTTTIKDVSPLESRHLLDFLFAHAAQPEFQCRLRWRNNSLAIWDNRAVQHRGIPDYERHRILHRVAIGGTWRPH